MGIKQLISKGISFARKIIGKVKPMIGKGIKLYQGKVKPMLGKAIDFVGKLPGYRDQIEDTKKKVGDTVQGLIGVLPESKARSWLTDKYSKVDDFVQKGIDKTKPALEQVQKYTGIVSKYKDKADAFADKMAPRFAEKQAAQAPIAKVADKM